MAPRCQHVAVFADVFHRCRLAKARHVGVLPSVFLTAPSVVGVSDLLDFFVGEFAPSAIHQNAQLAGVDEQDLPAPVAQALTRILVTGQEPKAGGNLRGVKELPR